MITDYLNEDFENEENDIEEKQVKIVVPSDDIDVDIIEETTTPPEQEVSKEEPDVISEGAVYTMDQAAKELGVTPDSLRMFIRDMGEETIKLERTPGGHRRLSQENIDYISRLFEIKRNNKYTNAQLKAILQTNEGEILTQTNELEQLSKLLNFIHEQTREDLNDAIRQIKDLNTNLIEQKNAEKDVALIELKENVHQEVSSEIETLRKEIKEITSIVTALAEDNKKKDEENTQLKQQLNTILDNTTKKSIWPFSKK